MNSQLLAGVILLVLAGAILPTAQGISQGEVQQVLGEPIVVDLLKICKEYRETMDFDIIKFSYTKIFRLYYDDVDMLGKALGNFRVFEEEVKKAEDQAKVIKNHSDIVCEALDSFSEDL